MIDLRSDTVTQPTEEMRQAIFNSKVGDDVFGDDPTVNELQEYVADLLGKEDALFVPSGTMGNQISIGILTKPGDEIIAEFDSHIFQYEAGAPALISGVQLRCIYSSNGMMKEEDIIKAIRPDDIHAPHTSLICIENTHNRHGGTIISLDYIHRIEKIAHEHNLLLHCDGARLWNACSATGISPKEYAKPFDTITVCLSKALGAPIGSVISSTKQLINSARRRRKVMGGGMRQAGIIASAGLYALKNHFDLLKQDHKNAKLFSRKLYESKFFEIDPAKVETNIVIFYLKDGIEPNNFAELCKENGVYVIPMGGQSIRAVFHFQIDEKNTIEAANILCNLTEKLL
ncbi:MAG: GntG family PLP-dependent aldolase [FCB group bacterium]|jgi:threonine aldolase